MSRVSRQCWSRLYSGTLFNLLGGVIFSRNAVSHKEKAGLGALSAGYNKGAREFRVFETHRPERFFKPNKKENWELEETGGKGEVEGEMDGRSQWSIQNQ